MVAAEIQSDKVAQRRAAMPGLASIIDNLREQFGVDFVNQQLATAQQARRCTFYAKEGDQEFGMPSPFGQNL